MAYFIAKGNAGQTVNSAEIVNGTLADYQDQPSSSKYRKGHIEPNANIGDVSLS